MAAVSRFTHIRLRLPKLFFCRKEHAIDSGTAEVTNYGTTGLVRIAV